MKAILDFKLFPLPIDKSLICIIETEFESYIPVIVLNNSMVSPLNRLYLKVGRRIFSRSV